MGFLEQSSPKILSILRMITALLLIQHGLMKFFHFPMAIPGAPDPLPPLIMMAGAIELVGGTLIAVGLFTRVAAFVCSGEMAFAYFLGHAPKGFWPVVNQGEPAIMFCFVFLFLASAGPGCWSIDSLRRGKADQA